MSCHFASCSLPTALPSPAPSETPTSLPTDRPTPLPTSLPTQRPSDIPSPLPTFKPSPSPSSMPIPLPSSLPTSAPTRIPTSQPTIKPSLLPTSSPTTLPTPLPSLIPTSTCVNGIEPAQYQLTLSDDTGNGWDGVKFVIKSLTNASLGVVFSETLTSGSFSSKTWICLTSDCYKLELNSTNIDISWRLEVRLI